jgi:hemoglobin
MSEAPTGPAEDILTFEHCRALVDAFYGEARRDSLLGPVFDEKVHDWPSHLDTMARFWSTVLFGREAYHGNPLAKHLLLAIDRSHFDRWIAIWGRVVDELFRGPRADMAKARAGHMADVMVERIAARAGRRIA